MSFLRGRPILTFEPEAVRAEFIHETIYRFKIFELIKRPEPRRLQKLKRVPKVCESLKICGEKG